MITKLQQCNHTQKNRAFNCRMRNRYYEEVYYAFRSLIPNELSDKSGETTEADVSWYQHLSKEIKRYERLLITCLEYGQAAIFYGKAEYSSLYSKDKRWGILQEEIFLVHFLQELLSTTRYVIARIETDHVLQQWSTSMQGMKSSPVTSGFVSEIQKKLDTLNASTIDEFKDLLKHVLERFQIGNTLFGTIQELQNFY